MFIKSERIPFVFSQTKEIVQHWPLIKSIHTLMHQTRTKSTMCATLCSTWQSWITLTSICDSDKWQCSLNCCHVPSGWDIQATGCTPDHQSHRNALKMYVYRIILLLYYQVQHCFNASSCATIPQLFLFFQWYVLFAWCVNGISSLTPIKNLPSSLTLRVTLLSKYSDVFFSPFLFQNGNWNQLISRQEIQTLTILHLC